MNIKISEENSGYMYRFIQKIIDECGPRMPCSAQEAKASELIKGELEKVCDDVNIETFSCQPRAFLGYIKVIVILIFSSFVFFFLVPLNLITYWEQMAVFFSFSLNVTAFIILWNEFFNYREFIDPLFKTRTSQNVIGTIKPLDKVKKILIFSGHHDSALNFNLLWYLKIGYPIIIFLGLGILILWLVLSLLILSLSLVGLLVYKTFFNITIWIFIVGFPVLIALLLFVSPGERANKVPGAVDNLSAVAIVLGIGKYLQTHKEIIPKGTEIRLISFGCEEAGLRGAYRYVENHYNELKDFNAECINMDGIQSKDKVSIIDFEPTTRTKHSKIIVDKLMYTVKQLGFKGSPSALGGSSIIEKIFGQVTGGTDATAFSKAGIKATNISAMDLIKFLQFYHQPTDTLDKIEKGSLEKVLQICIGYLINESK